MAIKKKARKTGVDSNVEVISNSDSKIKRKNNKKKTLEEVKNQVFEDLNDLSEIDRDSLMDLDGFKTFLDKDLDIVNDGEEINIVKVGRPTEYNYKVMLKKYIEYIKGCNDSWQRLVKTRTRGQAFDSDGFDYKLKVRLPSIEGYALHTGFALETIYDWKSKYPLFSDIIKDLEKRQLIKLLEGGMSGRYNPVITKVLLAKHGYVEQIDSNVKQATTITFARPASPFNQEVKIKEKKK